MPFTGTRVATSGDFACLPRVAREPTLARKVIPEKKLGELGLRFTDAEDEVPFWNWGKKLAVGMGSPLRASFRERLRAEGIQNRVKLQRSPIGEEECSKDAGL